MPATGEVQKRWALLGCSRGLGRAFLELLHAQEPTSAKLLISRKVELLSTFAEPIHVIRKMDFAKQEEWPQLLSDIREFSPTHLIYFAGGGPYGSYQQKSWKDHEWAWRVTFQCPAFLLHALLTENSLRQFTVIGSQIAEANVDPGAASYCAGKHALKGLISTVMKESATRDVRLFSPGYLDTELLPAHAWPRQQTAEKESERVKSPKEAAKALWEWLQNDVKGAQHLRWPRSPKL
jgi:short-subunit dehydrogenase